MPSFVDPGNASWTGCSGAPHQAKRVAQKAPEQCALQAWPRRRVQTSPLLLDGLRVTFEAAVVVVGLRTGVTGFTARADD
eukprot:4963252-Prymnesium_polylepis.1